CTAPLPAPGASVEIGPAGGTVSIGSAVTLTIPAGALASPTTVTLAPIAETVEGAERALSAVYQLGPASLSFTAPATLVVDVGSAVSAPDDVTLRVAQGGAYTSVATTRSGTAYSASVTGAATGYAARVSAAPSMNASACTTPTAAADLYTLASALDPQPIRLVARPTGFDAVVTYPRDSLFGVFRYPYDAAGGASPSVSLVANPTYSSLGGGSMVVEPDGHLVVVRESNRVNGSEIWVSRSTAAGVAVGAAVRLSNDTALSQYPQIVRLTSGGLVVVWWSRDLGRNQFWLSGAALGADLSIRNSFDASPSATGSDNPATSFGLVTDGSLVGVAWATPLLSGKTALRFRSFTGLGCPVTAAVDVANDTFDADSASAAILGSQVVVAYGRSRTHLRVVDLASGLLGPSRVQTETLRRPAVASSAAGLVIAGYVSDGNVRAYRLSEGLDPLEQSASLGPTSAYGAAPDVAYSANGRQIAASWNSIVPANATGRVGFLNCP
ncbi:MAG: hypothetical protein FJ104_17465, partial [Deltaproteobacteria bacterium]|nr:hypothetical protein [Deltaproteobacteria bacterium]